jgi:L-threonylcarbamoyladenylate synthase
VGVRWPQHPLAQELISKAGVPLAAPSANRFGRTSPTKAAHVKDEFGDMVFVLEGDDSQIGIESTVLLVKQHDDVYELSILRKGALLQSQIDKVLGASNLTYSWIESVDKKESPGHMKHHYMPSVPFVICRNPQMKLSELGALLNSRLQELPDEVEGVKIIKPTTEIKKIEFLKLSTDPVQAARELYSQLRAASLRSPDALCFIQTAQHQGEMWESIFDRLYKAASLILD